MTIDEPFEYLTFGGTFGRTFSIYFDRLDFFSSLAGIVLVPFCILSISLAIFIVSVMIRVDEIPDFHPKHLPVVITILTIQIIAYSIVTIINRGAIIRGVALMYIGQNPTWWSCLKAAWAKKWNLIAANFAIYGVIAVVLAVPSILTTVAVMSPNAITISLASVVGVICLAVAMYGYVGVVMTNPAIMVENFSGPVQGIQRSWELATGSRCYLLCTLFCLWFMNNAVARLLHNMFDTGDVMDILFSVVGIVVTVLPLLIFFPLHAILETVMYLNLRIGRESMNHQVLSGDLMTDAPQAARFRNDNAAIEASAVPTHMDYRHVPLMDDEETNLAPLNQIS